MIPDGPYTDMHTHILPGIDDGSQSMDETISMLRQAYDEGIRVIIATPHFGMRNPLLTKEKAAAVLERVGREAGEAVPGMKLILGGELFYSDGIISALDSGVIPTLGGTSYAMVEFAPNESRERIVRCIRDLCRSGYRPVIAHLERCRSLEGDVRAVEELVDSGAAVQINCRSFISDKVSDNKRPTFGIIRRKRKEEGFFLERKAGWARLLLSEGLVHLIGSDCHDDSFRTPVYRSALEAMEGFCSDGTLTRIAIDNPARLLDNEKLI